MALARNWLFSWIEAHGGSRKSFLPPWTAGRRAIHWLSNSRMILSMQDEANRARFAAMIASHADALRRKRQPGGNALGRFEALAGLVCAEAATGKRAAELAGPAEMLARECRSTLSNEDGLGSRNPEELVLILQNLIRAAAALDSAGCMPAADHVSAMHGSAATLRSLRHRNGALARFHGGGSLPVDLTDRTLCRAAPGMQGSARVAMGFAHMAASDTSVIVDVAPPPVKAATETAHASTLAFEAVSGGCPLVVNCGPGSWLGAEEARAARTVSAQSTVEIEGVPASRLVLSQVFMPTQGRDIANAPSRVELFQSPGQDGLTVIASHNGYVPFFGLTHMRRLDVTRDGGRIWGEDTIWAKDGPDRLTYNRSLDASEDNALVAFARFHLHPDTRARPVRSSNRVELELPNGEVWTCGFEGLARLEIEDSTYLDEDIFEARSASQIVLRSRTINGATQFRWEFERKRGRA